jgi:cell division septation protein DedD
LGTDGFACDGGPFSGTLVTTVAQPKTPDPVVANVPVVEYGVDVKQMASQPNPARFWVQFGAYKLEANARIQYEATLESGLENLQIVKDGKLFRIVAGPYSDRFSAEALKYYLDKEKKLKGIVTIL